MSKNQKLKLTWIGKDEQIEETPVHTALREALVNTLIHADYSGRVSVLIVKRPDMFSFRNPGRVRIPIADAKRGGTSDCRNRSLQKMFQLLGAGEQAGSGIPKIYKNWSNQHWRQPEFVEKITADREETLLRLRMVSLLPQDVVSELGKRFGKPFYELLEIERVALVTATIEGTLTHARLMEMSNKHPRDLSQILHNLVEQKMLESDGVGRGTYYFLPGHLPSTTFESLDLELAHKESELAHKDLELAHKEKLTQIAEQVAMQKRADPKEVRDIIVTLCTMCELSNQELAHLLNRNEKSLRTHYLNPLCEEGLLRRKYSAKNHPRQKYRIGKTQLKKSFLRG